MIPVTDPPVDGSAATADGGGFRVEELAPPERRGRIAVYEESHLARLREIRSLAERGFTLAQIKELSTADARGLLADLAVQDAPDPDLDRAELARRAEVPEFIIDVVVGAGLLTPAGDGDAQRFPPDAVDMLTAARVLVSEGVTLEELTALAMRHATHVEDVIDDAIELFKRHSDERGGDRDDLIALVHRLVPVASDLVGRHFERTLRNRALARIGDDPAIGGGIVVVARRMVERLDPLAVFAAATDHHRALWIRPEERLAIVGLGAVEVIAPSGDGRFSATSAARAALAARVRRVGPGDAPAPVLVGGFSFTCGGDDREPDWDGFPDARWILPEITVIDRIDATWMLAAAEVAPGEDERSAIAALDSRLDEVEAQPPLPFAAGPEIRAGEVVADDRDYADLVADAIRAIGAGEFGKVVLARTCRHGRINPVEVLHRLRFRYPTCAVFSIAVGDRQFLGASPEELVALDGREVRTAALAGTTGVGWDETTDRGLAAEMLASPKIRAEHRFVVDDMVTRLAALGLVGEVPREPEVLRLARLQHLRTPITARVERRAGGVSDMDVMRVASVLHPTPAVAGTPTEAAVDWLTARESFDRGWYASPIGWCDLDGNGELRVALRSALVDPDGVRRDRRRCGLRRGGGVRGRPGRPRGARGGDQPRVPLDPARGDAACAALAAHLDPARRALGGLLRARPGPADRPPVGAGVHVGDGCGELPARGGGGPSRGRADDRVHRRPTARAARVGCGPDHRPGGDLRSHHPLGRRPAGRRRVDAGPGPHRRPPGRGGRNRGRRRAGPSQLAAARAARTGG